MGSNKQSGLPQLEDDSRSRNLMGSVELRPRVSPQAKLIGITVVGIFWNSIVAVFVLDLFEQVGRGRFDWLLALFLSPFVLIGIGFICGIFYFLLSLANPRPVLKLKSTRVKPGETFEVSWKWEGNSDRFEHLRVYLEGREEATYVRGTTTTTDKSVFTTIELTQTRGKSNIRQGNVRCTIPEGTMHTFLAANNKIVWNLVLHGEIPNWPDVKEEFEISVIPFEERELRQLKYD